MSPDPRLTLRPHISTAPAASPDEAFQNETLRPVAKLQHDLLLAVFTLYLGKRKVRMDQIASKQRFAKVKELVARDNRLRGLLFGIIVGQFTSGEIDYYVSHEREVNRRLTNLLTERLSGAV